MARLLEHFRESPHPCPYLPDQHASAEIVIAVDVTAPELGALLDRGWRRFGPCYFRPACASCEACVSTRIPVSAFSASRSQRRACRAARRLTRVVGAPVIDAERLDLYARWHANREGRRGWDAAPIDADRYSSEFAFPHPSVREVAFRDPAQGNRLLGLGIVDEVPAGLSAVYFFWDPDRAPASLGTAHIVGLVDEAAARGLSYVYLGYRVDACPSLAYKARFQPQESLVGRPGAGERPVWRAQPAAPGE